jgi:ABC-type transport system involved in multi-copper enzyme maturation permease subunit
MNEERERVDKLLAERTASISMLQKGVEYWLSQAATMLFIIAMLGFIAACAGYVPAMIEAGSIDLVLSKPIRRWHLFFGKYIGGLLLISAALLAVYVAVFTGTGLVTGVWHWPFFNALPMTIFSLALLNAIVGWVGLWTRSTSMAMVIGYVYYLVVDTAVALLADPAAAPFLNELKGVGALAEFVKATFPSFKWLRESAEASIFSVWFFPWKHLVVGAIWLVVCLGTAYNRFRINDY